MMSTTFFVAIYCTLQLDCCSLFTLLLSRKNNACVSNVIIIFSFLEKHYEVYLWIFDSNKLTSTTPSIVHASFLHPHDIYFSFLMFCFFHSGDKDVNDGGVVCLGVVDL